MDIDAVLSDDTIATALKHIKKRKANQALTPWLQRSCQNIGQYMGTA